MHAQTAFVNIHTEWFIKSDSNGKTAAERLNIIKKCKMKVIPVLDKIIIEQDEAQDRMGGFAISDTSKEKPRQGTVVAIGGGAMNPNGGFYPMITKVGDKVMYGEFSGQPIYIEGKEYIIIKEGDLLLVL